MQAKVQIISEFWGVFQQFSLYLFASSRFFRNFARIINPKSRLDVLNRLLSIIILLFASVCTKASEVEKLRAYLSNVEGVERINVFGRIYQASLDSPDVDYQVRCLYDLLAETQRQNNVEEECVARTTRIILFYNNEMSDSVYAHVEEDKSFLKQAGDWEKYYQVWALLVNCRVYGGESQTALDEVNLMFRDALKRKNSLGMGMAYYTMAEVYMSMNNYDEATANYQKSIDMLSTLSPLPSLLFDAYSCLGDVYDAQQRYEGFEAMLDKWKQNLISYEKSIQKNNKKDNQTSLAPQWGYYYVACAQYDLGRDSLAHAGNMLDEVEACVSDNSEYLHLSWLFYKARLLMLQGNYREALSLNSERMQYMEDLDDKSVLISVRKQRAEILLHLGFFEQAAQMYREMYDINDSINIRDTKKLLTEMNTRFHVDELKMEQAKARMRNVIIIACIIFISLLVFTIFRVRSARKLKLAHDKLEQAHGELEKTHNDLLTAYDRLEETTAAKERIESDLRIARNIQMSMVPNVFPNRPDVDLFASMTPAKEVGGDLYGYVLSGDMLYFALGDVSGKGVPASLFMAQATRLFRTLAAQGMQPAEICTRINDALSGEDNEQGMFVTMFLGLIDLATGHLSFCNAGHNPPVLLVDGKAAFVEMIPNAPIGIFPELDFEGEEIADISNQPLFVYTDGLNEAENRQQEQFTDERLLEILETRPFESSRQTVEMLKDEVELHRDGAEPNDDLTMLCVKITR